MTLRKPFRGIHEISSRGAGIHEGGGDLRPYGEDIFQRVVDVNWVGAGGAIFVSGDVCCYIRAADIPELTLEQQWEPVGVTLFGDNGGHIGSTYAFTSSGGPTFLMVGNNDGTQPHNNPLPYGALAMVSHDGFNWQVGLHIPFGGRFYNTVWDGSRFFVETGGGQCYASPNGYNWNQEPDGTFGYHCPNGIPDGIVGYDPVHDHVIFPDDIDLIAANCTAYAGGIWMAGGYRNQNSVGSPTGGASITISSINGGKDWAVVTQGRLTFPFDDPITTMIGAPLGDFA